MMFDTDFHKTFNEMARTILGGVAEIDRSPRVNLYENDDAVTVEAAMPGVDAGSIEVNLDGDMLTIAGERKAREGVDAQDYSWHERATGPMRRQIKLRRPVDRDAITASYEHGLLVVTLPKAAEAKPRKIDVQVK